MSFQTNVTNIYSQKMDISIVIPLFNEEESLPELTEWIHKVMVAERLVYEVVFVDDGSTDNSWAVIQDLKRQFPAVKAIKFQRNYGKSAGLNEGFKMATGNVVVTMDADLQDSPDELPDLYKMIMVDGYDLVSGWKKKRYDSKLTKNIPSKLFNAVTRKMSGIQLNDFNWIKSVEVYGEMHRYIPVMAKAAGFRKIGEKVVQHRARKYGVSKFGWERFVNGFLDLMTVQFIGKFGKKPMHFFGLIGSVLFLLGLLTTAYLILCKIFMDDFAISNRPPFYIALTCIVMGSIFFTTGFLAELTLRNSVERNNYLIDEKIQ
jgi:glycosyltransferase involved in cell wall biosynthesis